jgi:hypothetical protein
VGAALLGAGPDAAAQQPGATPLEDIPTVEGAPDATTVPARPSGGRDAAAPVASPTAALPSLAGTVSTWRSSENRAGIRIASEHGADRLIDAPVVDSGGRELGTITDLLVDSDGMVRKALVQPAGVRPLVVELAQLRERLGQRGFVADLPAAEQTSPD